MFSLLSVVIDLFPLDTQTNAFTQHREIGHGVGLEFLFNTCSASPFEFGIGDAEAFAFGLHLGNLPEVDFDPSGQRLYFGARKECHHL